VKEAKKKKYGGKNKGKGQERRKESNHPNIK
jgi:hypothetical protein